MEWSRELKAKVPMALTLTLRKATRAEGEGLVADLGLTPDELEAVLSLCLAGPAPGHRHENRGRWMAAAWLCGASYRQLAALHGIGFSTVRDHVQRRISDRPTRIAESVTPSQLHTMWRIWLDRHTKIPTSMPIEAVANMLAVACAIDKPPQPPVDWCS